MTNRDLGNRTEKTRVSAFGRAITLSWALVATTALIGSTGVAFATQITVPNTFVNGTIADADEVNANFDALVTESNAQDRLLSGEVAYQVDLHSYFFTQSGGCAGACTVVDSANAITTTHVTTVTQDVLLHFDLPIPKYNNTASKAFVITKVGAARGGSNRMWCRNLIEVDTTGVATSLEDNCGEWYNGTPGYIEWDFPDITTSTQNRYYFRFHVTTGINDTELTNPIYGVTVFGKWE